jgi:serine/threonine protein kinase
MVMFQVSGKATPASKDVLQKAQMLKPKDVIGSGGFGTVYKLEMNDKTTFAVKKLARCGQDGDRGFERELETLADIKHRNLVALRGYYSSPETNILIYDLMPNGNLDSLLHGTFFLPYWLLSGVKNLLYVIAP